jgi:hypothetical protein
MLLAPLVAAAANDLNWDIVDEMSTVKELMLSPDGTVAEPLVAGLDEVPALGEDAADAEVVEVGEDDEQPAAITAATAATATQPNRGTDLNVPWPCERGGRPPRPLLSSSIPYPFRHNALGYADAGHRTTRVSFRDER